MDSSQVLVVLVAWIATNIVADPIVTVAKKKIYVRKGESAILECRYNSSVPVEDLQITWFKVNQDTWMTVWTRTYLVNKASEMFCDKFSIPKNYTLSSKRGHAMELCSAKMEDSGAYICRVEGGVIDTGDGLHVIVCSATGEECQGQFGIARTVAVPLEAIIIVAVIVVVIILMVLIIICVMRDKGAKKKKKRREAGEDDEDEEEEAEGPQA